MRLVHGTPSSFLGHLLGLAVVPSVVLTLAVQPGSAREADECLARFVDVPSGDEDGT